MTLKASYENGVFKPQVAVHLVDDAEVEVLIPSLISIDADDPTGWKAAVALSGFTEDARLDRAERHNQWLKI